MHGSLKNGHPHGATHGGACAELDVGDAKSLVLLWVQSPVGLPQVRSNTMVTSTGIEGLREEGREPGLSGVNREKAEILGGSKIGPICDCSRQAGFDCSNVARLASEVLAALYQDDSAKARRYLLRLLADLETKLP